MFQKTGNLRVAQIVDDDGNVNGLVLWQTVRTFRVSVENRHGISYAPVTEVLNVG